MNRWGVRCRMGENRKSSLGQVSTLSKAVMVGTAHGQT
jgi:hypothetical protein